MKTEHQKCEDRANHSTHPDMHQSLTCDQVDGNIVVTSLPAGDHRSGVTARVTDGGYEYPCTSNSIITHATYGIDISIQLNHQPYTHKP